MITAERAHHQHVLHERAGRVDASVRADIQREREHPIGASSSTQLMMTSIVSITARKNASSGARRSGASLDAPKPKNSEKITTCRIASSAAALKGFTGMRFATHSRIGGSCGISVCEADAVARNADAASALTGHHFRNSGISECAQQRREREAYRNSTIARVATRPVAAVSAADTMPVMSIDTISGITVMRSARQPQRAERLQCGNDLQQRGIVSRREQCADDEPRNEAEHHARAEGHAAQPPDRLAS